MLKKTNIFPLVLGALALGASVYFGDLIKLYVFSLVLGAVLLGASILLGDTETDVEAEADLEMDFDADVDADADGHLDAPHDLGDLSGVDAAGADFFLWTFRSIRFWTFFVAFFGLTGLLLDGLDLVPPLVSLPIAIGMGAVIGTGASYAVKFLSVQKLGQGAETTAYVGKIARVILPIEPNGTGKVRLELQGTSVDMLATGEERFATNEEAMIIEIDGTTARVARIDTGQE